jgi:hypothetical protein
MSRTIVVFLALVFVSPTVHGQPKKDENAKKVDEAISKALKYLASTQNDDGSWGAGVRGGRHPALTGLAVMAFLSAGHVPGEGPHGKTVEKGIRAVLKMQHPNGLVASEAGHEMYHHGICTLMMAEAIGMTQGPLAAELKKAVEKALVITLQAQRKGNDQNKGGWRYHVASPTEGSDMSVTGWQILSLRAAKNVGCDVPPDVIDEAVKYVNRSRDPNTGGYCYTPHGGVTVPCTGTGILCLAVCLRDAKKLKEVEKAGSFLLRDPVAWGGRHFFYSIYYCSQACFQLGGNYWEAFRPKLHDVLLKHQQPNGSWPSLEGYGPNYATSMAVLAMTVEYRFLPIYQRGEEPTDKK